MSPKTKVILYFVINAVLIVLCLAGAVIAVAHHSYSLTAAALIMAAITTFFASSTKFAKEVKWIRRWKRVTGCPITEYPCSIEDRVRIRRKLYVAIHALGMAVNEVEERLTGALLREPDDIANLRAEKYKRMAEFQIYWQVLRHVKALPINLATNQPWKGKEFKEFLEHIKATAKFMPSNSIQVYA